MSIYVIGDLHLSFSADKPMDIFGYNWEKHADKIKESWLENVTEYDTVILPGDFSWATYLSETYKDFEFILDLSEQVLIKKINLLVEFIENMNYNLNSELLLDRFVIEMSGIDD